MIAIQNRESAALYRKLLLAYLIDSQPKMNAIALHKETNFPKRTVQNNLADMENISIIVKYHGSSIDGYYTIESWGVFCREKVYSEIEQIKTKLYAYLN